MKIVMLKSELGQDQEKSSAAKPQRTYLKGVEYDVGESLGKAFIEMGVAKEAGGVPASDPIPKPKKPRGVKDKSLKGAPENKGA